VARSGIPICIATDNGTDFDVNRQDDELKIHLSSDQIIEAELLL